MTSNDVYNIMNLNITNNIDLSKIIHIMINDYLELFRTIEIIKSYVNVDIEYLDKSDRGSVIGRIKKALNDSDCRRPL